MRTLVAVDFDKHACATYSENFPDAEVRCAKVEEQGDSLPYADIIHAGPPCQSFSLAGKGLGHADGRNGWPAFVAAVTKVKPRQFLAENVAGMMTEKHRPYLARVMRELELLGYRVEMRKLDAVNFGVPQFRDRIWLWGIRNDVKAVHRWPKPTHVWPWPEAGMFGGELQRAVTVGWALNIPHRQADGVWWEPFGEPFGEYVQRQSGSRKSPTRTVGEPAPTLGTELLHGNRGIHAKVIGGGSHPALRRGEDSARDITAEPCTTLNKEAHHGDNSPVVEYRYSDAMLKKHPPASPASLVMAKYYKGGAEGLVEVCDDHGVANCDGPAPTIKAGGNTDFTGKQGGGCPPTLIVDDPKHQPHQPANTLNSGGAGHGMSGATGCLEVDTKQPRTSAPVSAPVSALGTDSRHVFRAAKKMVRRLTPDECARLQSMPDDFRWPAKITKTAKYRIIGNGQASLMAHVLAQALQLADPESETVIDLFCGGGLGACGFHGRFWQYLGA